MSAVSNTKTTGNDENVCYLKPEDIAEKLDVPATRIGVYARNFEEILINHMELTPGGHRRFSSTGFKLLFEIHYLIKNDGLSYAQAKEEMLRRMKDGESLKNELATYDLAKQLTAMSDNEKQFYNTLIAMQEENVRIREQLSEFMKQQQFERQVTNNKIEELSDKIAELSEVMSKQVNWATITLNMLEMRGKPSFFAKLFGVRNEEEEKRITDYCKSIIENDRQEKRLTHTKLKAIDCEKET